MLDLLRTRGGSGAGMERRIGIIDCKKCLKDETVKVISQLTKNPSKFSVDLEYQPDLPWRSWKLAKPNTRIEFSPIAQ